MIQDILDVLKIHLLHTMYYLDRTQFLCKSLDICRLGFGNHEM